MELTEMTGLAQFVSENGGVGALAAIMLYLYRSERSAVATLRQTMIDQREQLQTRIREVESNAHEQLDEAREEASDSRKELYQRIDELEAELSDTQTKLRLCEHARRVTMSVLKKLSPESADLIDSTED
ncbi:MAG: hypothetical protein OXE52_04945 [Chloroflexi bacterium]|nr:hypothetical protein [Chloroflexota bacterium]